jgi:hypothetical protein
LPLFQVEPHWQTLLYGKRLQQEPSMPAGGYRYPRLLPNRAKPRKKKATWQAFRSGLKKIRHRSGAG